MRRALSISDDEENKTYIPNNCHYCVRCIIHSRYIDFEHGSVGHKELSEYTTSTVNISCISGSWLTWMSDC